MTVRPRALILLCAMVMLAGACESTVQVDRATSSAGGEPGGQPNVAVEGDGLTLGIDDVGGTDDAGASGGGDASGGATGGSLGEAPGPGTTTSGSSDGTPNDSGTATEQGSGSPTESPEPPAGGEPFRAAVGAAGITDTQIFVGFEYAEDAGAANAAVGYNEFTRGDQRRNHDAMVEHINGTGGIAGRELVPVFHVWSEGDNQTLAQREQQMCATWTQDNDVFVAVIDEASDTLRQCLANAGVSLITVQGLGISDDKTFADFPSTVEPTNLSLNPMARLTVEGLAAQNYFDAPGPALPTKVGVVSFDYPTFRRAVAQDLLPALESLDLEVVAPAFVKMPERYSDAGESSAQLSNAVLRFNREGVSHVLIFEHSAFLTVVFLNSAETQGYRPRYGFNSQNGGQAIVGSVPERQLHGTLQVGWAPRFDVLDVPMWPARRECLALFKEAGIAFDSTNADGRGMIFCDMYKVLRQGIENAPGALDRQTVARGFEELGTSFQSAQVQDVRLTPGRRYGVASYRLGAFVQDCSCFQYTAGPFGIK